MLDSPRIRSPASGYGFPQTYGAGPSSSTGKGRKTGLKSRATQLLALRFGWVVLVIWYEVGEFFHSLSTCRFPDAVLRDSTSTYADTPPTHVVLLADPHVPHPVLSYPRGSKPWFNMLRQAMDELFMRKSWNVVMRLGRVDAVIVLGDMLDWGRGDMSEQEYEEYFNLFHSIFQLPDSVPMYYVPGNHDLPLGPNRLFSPYARERYARHFSPPNAILPVANHTLILLDAVGLVEEDYRRYAAEMQFGEWDGVEGGVIEFVKQLGDEPPQGPSILISHIPLARPEASRCGPLREKGRILKGAGPGYQNLLGSETTRFLLDVIRPSVVFSGDDHDYCELMHPAGVKEVTLKSFSSSQGIRRPGFQLLSLIPPSDISAVPRQITHADRPCFLPDQLGVYTRVYLPVAILTVLFLFGSNLRTAWNRWNAAGHTIYGDIKARLSPSLSSGEYIPPSATVARRVSDRPLPLSLPSRKSSQQLSGMGQPPTPRSARNSFFGLNGSGGGMTPTGNDNFANHQSTRLPSQSAPVSPSASPRPSYSGEDGFGYGYPASNLSRMEEDIENDNVSSYDLPTPSISRRSSYIYMSGRSTSGSDQTPRPGHPPGLSALQTEPSSYFLPLPNTGSGAATTGLGFSSSPSSSQHPSPIHGPIRRVSSTNLSAYSSHNHNYSNYPYAQPSSSSVSLSLPHPPQPQRRVTMPRLLTTNDWSSAAKAKDKSVLGLLADSMSSSIAISPSRKYGTGIRGWINMIRAFVGWCWRSRNGVVAKSWKEAVAIAWPAGVVWVAVNALFFWA